MVRTGIVLAPGGGALEVMTPDLQAWPGHAHRCRGQVPGSEGNQWMSWIHIDDIVGIFRLAIENGAAKGPLNGTAPSRRAMPNSHGRFRACCASAYTPWRVYLPFGPPDGLLRLMLGEVASVITTGQRVLPKKAPELGYVFKYPHLADALRAVVEHVPAEDA